MEWWMWIAGWHVAVPLVYFVVLASGYVNPDEFSFEGDQSGGGLALFCWIASPLIIPCGITYVLYRQSCQAGERRYQLREEKRKSVQARANAPKKTVSLPIPHGVTETHEDIERDPFAIRPGEMHELG